MRYRRLDANNDFVFGLGGGNFLVDTPETVAQAVETRLRLAEGEWFLDITTGTPYQSRILGAGKVGLYDAAIQEVILGTPNVRAITEYTSSVDPSTRKASISVTIDTAYGTATVQTTL
jgi:hypothetical protein